MKEQFKRNDIIEEEKEKFKDIGSDLASDFGRLGKATKEAASDTLGAVKEDLSDLYQEGQKKFAEVGGQLENRIRSHPMRALFIAAGIGLVIGLMKRK